MEKIKGVAGKSEQPNESLGKQTLIPQRSSKVLSPVRPPRAPLQSIDQSSPNKKLKEQV